MLLFLAMGVCLGQHPGNGECALHPENKAWILQYKKAESQENQIDMVVQKIIADTDYFVEHPEMANLDDRRVFGKMACTTDCSIRFALVYEKKKGLVIDLKKNPELAELILEFNSENIESIHLNEYNDKDIYSPAALKRSGIILYTSDRDLKKKIRKAVKNMSKT
ncbi:hypothetical protein ATE92_1912 [Ulvibacter sp. MAR_2010_11]|uniref:hypothetical protein n=1 Tax=Ulvibacter sp. MAR_2010_11 TaxID=1250229 RepID=UPI000CC37850|nr:hypothetical protein [Ulvibacter sp. MAR_2010_11]PKA83746.1 hypothetical protein ATE92_1912 [Ulvibacter sp. MAR_2010_11]